MIRRTLRLAFSRPRLKIPPTLWYENEEGVRIDAGNGGPDDDLPAGFIYQHSRFAREVCHDVSRSILAEEVSACEHPAEHVTPTYGWIDGVQGRKCRACEGHQTRDDGEPWPEEWSSEGSVRICGGSSTWPASLVAAMTRPTTVERLRRVLRGYLLPPRLYSLPDAVQVAATTCEACMNTLMHEYGVNDGYREGSREWRRAGTSCELDRPHPPARRGPYAACPCHSTD